MTAKPHDPQAMHLLSSLGKVMTNNENVWTLEAVLKATGGELLVNGNVQIFPGISTDSRTLSPGELFVALTGENFDGHQFVEEAASKGAASVVVALDNAERLDAKGLRIPVIGVSDTALVEAELAKRDAAPTKPPPPVSPKSEEI